MRRRIFVITCLLLLGAAGLGCGLDPRHLLATWSLVASSEFLNAGHVVEIVRINPGDSPAYRDHRRQLRGVSDLAITGDFAYAMNPLAPGDSSLVQVDIWLAPADSLASAQDFHSFASRIWGPLPLMPGDSVRVGWQQSTTLMGSGRSVLAQAIIGGDALALYIASTGAGPNSFTLSRGTLGATLLADRWAP